MGAILELVQIGGFTSVHILCILSIVKKNTSKQEIDMTTYKLSTKGFGKKARRETLEILGEFKYKKAGHNAYKIVNSNNELIAYVEAAAWDEDNATLTVI